MSRVLALFCLILLIKILMSLFPFFSRTSTPNALALVPTKALRAGARNAPRSTWPRLVRVSRSKVATTSSLRAADGSRKQARAVGPRASWELARPRRVSPPPARFWNVGRGA